MTLRLDVRYLFLYSLGQKITTCIIAHRPSRHPNACVALTPKVRVAMFYKVVLDTQPKARVALFHKVVLDTHPPKPQSLRSTLS